VIQQGGYYKCYGNAMAAITANAAATGTIAAAGCPTSAAKSVPKSACCCQHRLYLIASNETAAYQHAATEGRPILQYLLDHCCCRRRCCCCRHCHSNISFKLLAA
jgi:hypothetical protein